MQSLRVTLYEIFGYFVPGLIAITGIAIGFWAVYLPTTPITPNVLKVRPVLFALIGFTSYIVGHLLQAIGNLHTRAEKRKDLCSDCESLRVAALNALARNYQIVPNSQSLSEVTTLASAIMSQDGKTDNYEIFVYREGFYRAGYISFIALAISLSLRAIHPTFLGLHGSFYLVPRSSIIAMLSLCLVTSLFYFLRFRRFGEYRVRHILGVMAACHGSKTSDLITAKE